MNVDLRQILRTSWEIIRDSRELKIFSLFTVTSTLIEPRLPGKAIADGKKERLGTHSFTRIWIGFCLATAILTACTQDPQPATTSEPTTLPASETAAHGPAVSLSPTLTLAPSRTPAPTYTPRVFPTSTSTGTATPFPIFDPAAVVTHTPAAPAECPPEDPDFVVGFDPDTFTDHWYEHLDLIQAELDRGASLQQVANAANAIYRDQYGRESDAFPLYDLNIDGVDEMLFSSDYLTLYVLGCHDGGHTIMLEYSTSAGAHGPAKVFSIEDMNLNGTPELVLVYSVTSGFNLVADILEWNGVNFISLIEAQIVEERDKDLPMARALYWYDHFPNISLPIMHGPAYVEIIDLDQNGAKELVLADDGPDHWDTLISLGPWRGQTKVFTWDGLHFLYSSIELTPPEYRFQAVNDADRLFLLGDYERALALYQDVIFSDQLDFFSEDRAYFNTMAEIARLNDEPPPEMPAPDPDEYQALSAYARYRIMLLHLVQNAPEAARVVLDTLLELHPVGTVGYPYAEMASMLSDAYEESENLPQACVAVIEYVEANPELLDPLGNAGYHGGQAHRYIPEDTCPIR